LKKLISIPTPILEKLVRYADKYYNSNFSRFICDAGIEYGKTLDKEKERK
jgi:hypothetical protein